MQPRPVAIPRGHHRAHVVVEHLARDAAEEVKGALVATEQRLHPLVGDELDEGRPAPTQDDRDLSHEIADAAVCLASTDGGLLVLGVDDKLTGNRAMSRCSHGAVSVDWVRAKIRS